MEDKKTDSELLQKIKEYSKKEKFRNLFAISPEIDIDFELLAQGEYHKNFLFKDPVSKKKYVFRMNYGSQLHLENQIAYEYNALCQLKESARTPVPVLLDDSRNYFDQGILVMEYIEGDPLSYEKNLKNAAECLADVHCTKIKNPKELIEIKDPIMGILEECKEMFAVYKNSDVADPSKIQKIEELTSLAYRKASLLTDKSYENVCINTELNNHNFLVDQKTGYVSLIDWEKPLWGDPAQDIGHMLAPTTSFWRTDVILKDEVIEQFLEDYIHAVNGRIKLGELKKRVQVFLSVTCLRGITWCTMAYVEYMMPGREIINPDTFEKLKAYQSDEFLFTIKNYMLKH